MVLFDFEDDAFVAGSCFHAKDVGLAGLNGADVACYFGRLHWGPPLLPCLLTSLLDRTRSLASLAAGVLD